MKTNFWILLLAVATLGFVSCAKEPSVTDPDPQPGEEKILGYVAFNLSNTETSRAETLAGDAFDKGDQNEYAIVRDAAANRLIMFNEDGSYFGSTMLSWSDEAIFKPGHDDEHNGDANYKESEVLYAAIATYDKTDVPPASVLVVLNARPWRVNKLLLDLEAAGANAKKMALQWITLDNNVYPQEKDGESAAYYSYEGTPYFTMSSSIYVDKEGELAADVKLSSQHICSSVQLAAKNPVTVYVERLVAKFTLGVKKDENTTQYFGDATTVVTIDPSAAEGVDAEELYVQYQDDFTGSLEPKATAWKVHVANWGLNALEPNSFLFKNLVAKDQIDNTTWSGLNFYANWNAWWYHRSYWAVDQHYADGAGYLFGTTRSAHKYPSQYRAAFDNEDNDYLSYDETTIYDEEYTPGYNYVQNDWSLNYISYNDISTRAKNKYAHENTLNENLTDGGYLRAGTHVLVAAQLILEEMDADAGTSLDANYLLPNVEDKYFASNIFWTKDAYTKYAYYLLRNSFTGAARTCENIFDGTTIEFPETDGKFYLKKADDADDVAPTALALADATTYFELKPAYIKGGDGWVTLSLKEGYDLYLLPAADEADPDPDGDGDEADEPEYRKLTSQEVVSAIYRFSEAAKHFNEGRMYYALPIKHNANANTAFDAEKPAAGDFGVVRNHWYKLNITEVQKIGTPVSDPDQPIIPNNEPEQNAIGLEIVILPWHVIEEDVIL